MLEVQELKRIDEELRRLSLCIAGGIHDLVTEVRWLSFKMNSFSPLTASIPDTLFYYPVTFHTAFWWTLLSTAKTFQWLSPLVIEMLTLQTWLLQSIFPHLGHLPSLPECFPIHLPVHGPASLKGVSQTPPDTQDLHCTYTTLFFKDSLEINEKWKGVIGRELMKANTVARVLCKWKNHFFVYN